MNMALYAGLAIAAAFLALCLKQVKPEFALLVSLAAVIFIMAAILPRAVLMAADIEKFAQEGGISANYVLPVMKIIGIAYITEIASDICADAGEKALSSHVETAGKIAAAVISLPIAEEVFGLILGLLS